MPKPIGLIAVSFLAVLLVGCGGRLEAPRPKEQNRFDEALVKFTGPLFFPGSTEPSEIRIARIAYVGTD